MEIIDKTPKGLFSEFEIANEKWLQIDSNSFVSDLGRVKYPTHSHGICSDKYIISIGGKHSSGYRNYKGHTIHRLVAHYFIDSNFPIVGIVGSMQIDHIDTNRSNNRVSNLRICTQKENLNNPISKVHFSQSKIGKPNLNAMGKKRTIEQRNRMRDAQLKYYSTHESKNVGRKQTDISKEKNRLAHLGKSHPMSEQAREKISIAKTGFKHTENSKVKMAQSKWKGNIVAYLNETLVAEFSSWVDISNYVKAPIESVQTNVNRCINGKQKQYKGYYWYKL